MQVESRQAFDALVVVTMRDADRDTVEAFEQVVAHDLWAFQRLYDDRISTFPRRPAPQLHPLGEKRRRNPAATQGTTHI